ncbi:PAS domain-containing protein [Prosthecobacter sp.]|uniref:PAS domain-containing sensor histidine kinase n=1 Tax=Prosthecobacter sp. TaxID=1965333 RepID=UPI002AB95884|nr:PAS domain-containing protein [Prosthecobacter sp.]MDZ4403981.1 PAS domain-containing protein [Prosthecobacter sp.]
MKPRKVSLRTRRTRQTAATATEKHETAGTVKNKPSRVTEEQLRLIDELRESETRFHLMAEMVPVFIYTATPAGETDYVNQRLIHYTCLTAEQLLGHGWVQALHPDDREEAVEGWREAVEAGTSYQCDFRIRAANGTYRWFQNIAQPVTDEHGSIEKWFGSCADIDDLMRVQSDLTAANERLEERVARRTDQLVEANRELEHEFERRQRLENEMLEISEQERHTLGQDLHDGVCQHLSGVAMMAATLGDVCEQKYDSETATKLKEITKLIHSASDQARNVARSLHPVDVDANGLAVALRDLAARYAAPGKTKCRFLCSEPVPIHDNKVAMCLYRIVQDAVINATRHMAARRIIIHLGFREQCIMLSVSDDGSSIPESEDSHPVLGLKLMRHRASSIGATLTIEGRGGGGTVVKCSLPALV